ncbi:PLP-dependent transferase [Patescibacteria group bacterium]|nr:PLP-dependent transferase [Patescibacteria group bacterium]
MKEQIEENRGEKPGISGTYPSVQEWKQVFDDFYKGKSVKIYDRYGYPELMKKEEEIAKLVGVEKDELMLVNNGMAAVVEALESLGLKAGETILCSPYVYGQSGEYLKELESRGIICIKVDPGDIEEMKVQIDRHKPKAIFAEVVGNDEPMPVLNVEELFAKTEEINQRYKEEMSLDKVLERSLMNRAWVRKYLGSEKATTLTKEQQEKLSELVQEFEATARKIDQDHSYMPLRSLIKSLQEKGIGSEVDLRLRLLEFQNLLNSAWLAKKEDGLTLVLDNTLTTPTGFDLAKKMKQTSAPVIGIESGTKFYAHDTGTLGLVYGNAEKIAQMKVRRAVSGSYLPPAVEAILPERNPEEFKKLNKKSLETTRALALSFSKIIGKDGITAVSYPSLPEHKNYEYAEKEMPYGAAGVFYIFCEDAWKTAQVLEDRIGKENIEYGGSFGFDITRVGVFGEHSIRIAGGREEPEKLQAMCEAIESVE